MADTLGVEQNTYEVKIYVETAKEIFERCFSRAGISGKDRMPGLLAKELNAAFSDNKLEAKYIRNVYNKIIKPVAPYTKMGIYHSSIYTLARFAGIDDYLLFDKNYGPAGLQVMYTEKPYSLFNFLRTGSSGQLSRINHEWEYNDGAVPLKAGVTAFQCYTMPGDKNPYWLKITYTQNEQIRHCFFADISLPSPAALLSIQSAGSRLFMFFDQLLKDCQSAEQA